ncbi:MAG: Ig-like domain-containing protein [Bacteroidia bacterium]
MKGSLSILLVIIGLCRTLAAQDTIINAYAKVIEIDSCFIRVDTTLGFYAEDYVLMHQSKGATIDKSNSDDYGKLIKHNGAGLFEENRIQIISRDTIYLYKQVKQPFNVDFNVQIVGIRPKQKIESTATITAKPWDTSTGGIVYLKALDSITLNHNINVSGLGYNGGKVSQTRVKCNYDEFYCDYQSGYGGEKGESIVKLNNNTACRGASANGGGGGNASNTGGGGGGNAGSGGLGGKEVSFGSGACSNARVGGVGGKPILYDTLFNAIPRNTLNRLIFGGGGGGGQQNNEASDGVGGVAGMPGGGIIFINTPKLVSKNINLISNGKSVIDTAGRDGAGGGGAGGTVALFCDSYKGQINVEVNGGNGGNVDNNGFNSFCHGPGGGGGGGLLWLKQLSTPNNFSFSAQKGLAGKNVNSTSKCYQQTHGAVDGQPGYMLYDLKLNLAVVKRANCPPFKPIAIDDTLSTYEGVKVGYNIIRNDTIFGIYSTKLLKGKSLATINKKGKDSLVYQNFNAGIDTFQYCVCRKFEPILCDTANVTVKVIQRNQFIYLENDTVYVNEGDSIKIDFFENDTLKGKYTLCLNYSGSNNAKLNTDSTLIHYKSKPRNLGIDSFEYCACLIKNPAICDTAWIFVNIDADTSAPNAVNDTVSIIRNIDTCFYHLLNDTFKRAIDFNIIRTNALRTFNLETDSSICIKNHTQLPDTLIITYSICYTDTPKTCDTAQIIIVLNKDPNAPICFNDNYTMFPDTLLKENVVVNDLNTNNVAISLITPPAIGSLNNLSITGFEYQSGFTFIGTDSFQYKLTMNKPSYEADSAWVYITIQEPNQKPLAIDDGYIIYQDQTLDFNPVENDYDPDSDSLQFDIFLSNFSNGSISGSAPFFTYTPDPGYFGNDSATYKIIDDGNPNKQSRALIKIEVLQNPKLRIPNGFSPNNDGINDALVIENGTFYNDLHLVVYNRWGQVIYDNPNYKNDWQGINQNGSELTDGTYFYLVTVESINFKEEGYVVINR